MNLQELKNAIESDASKRADAQEKTIKELNSIIEDQKHRLYALEHRCYISNLGSLCQFCMHTDTCSVMQENEEDKI